jgi:hypothetical protein
MWKLRLFAAVFAIFILDDIVSSENYKTSDSSKFTIEELLSSRFPYTDPRTDHQLDMDPCKSGM